MERENENRIKQVMQRYSALGIYNAGCLIEIEKGLKRGINVELYARPEVVKQGEAVQGGIVKGFDGNYYRAPISANEMQMVRVCLESNEKIKRYASRNSDISNARLALICEAEQAGIDISKYRAKGKFDDSQLDVILRGLKQGLDVSVYAKKEFNVMQMLQIYYGLSSNVDVSIYAKPEYSANKMNAFLIALKME